MTEGTVGEVGDVVQLLEAKAERGYETLIEHGYNPDEIDLEVFSVEAFSACPIGQLGKCDYYEKSLTQLMLEDGADLDDVEQWSYDHGFFLNRENLAADGYTDFILIESMWSILNGAWKNLITEGRRT